jgi:hypothetical protein
MRRGGRLPDTAGMALPAPPVLVSGLELADLARSAISHDLNRAPSVAVEDGQTFIGPIADMCFAGEIGSRLSVHPDDEFIVRAFILSEHKHGGPAEPHYRCDVYRADTGERVLPMMLDVTVNEYKALRPQRIFSPRLS